MPVGEKSERARGRPPPRPTFRGSIISWDAGGTVTATTSRLLVLLTAPAALGVVHLGMLCHYLIPVRIEQVALLAHVGGSVDRSPPS